jgi:hypothetical protein
MYLLVLFIAQMMIRFEIQAGAQLNELQLVGMEYYLFRMMK